MPYFIGSILIALILALPLYGACYAPLKILMFLANAKHPLNHIFRYTWIITPLKNSTMLWSPKPSQHQVSILALKSDDRTNNLIVNNYETAGRIAYSRFDGQGVVGADYAGGAYRAFMDSQDEGGDGTVPSHSGQAPTTHVKFTAKLKGFSHGTSYDNKTVRAVTVALYNQHS